MPNEFPRSVRSRGMRHSANTTSYASMTNCYHQHTLHNRSVMLCSICSDIDLVALLPICAPSSSGLKSCQEPGEFEHMQLTEIQLKHHDDIFGAHYSAENGCELCALIIKAFKDRRIEDESIARGLPLMLTSKNNKLTVSIETSEGLIRICNLDIYIDGGTLYIYEMLRFQTPSLLFSELFLTNKKKLRGVLRKMSKDLGSHTTLEIASGWLNNCSKTHENCSQPVNGAHNLPKRVLNVGDEITDPFLVEPTGDSRSGKWAALSYCWGVEPSMKLTKQNETQLKRGKPLYQFDATIRDAILVTRALGLTYLWIDALCIFQDQSLDWNEQSSKMEVIYGESTVTIVAANSSSVVQGFLKERNLQYIALDRYQSKRKSDETLHNSIAQRIYIAPSWELQGDEITGDWTKRGWTMQEGLLPQRLLYFTSTQIIWKCCTAIEYERGIKQEPQKEIINGMVDGTGMEIWYFDLFSKFKALSFYLKLNPEIPMFEKYRLWYELVEEYTPRQFKKIQDRLVAISGLARIFSDLIEDTGYVAGLWKHDLLRGLLWRVRGAKLISSKMKRDLSCPSNEFPSWTWASVAYETVVYDHARQDGLRPFAVIEDVSVDLINEENQFGAVKSGRISITGPIFQFSRLYNTEWRCKEMPMSAFERHVSEIVEEESAGCVEERFCSSDGQFTALQILQPFPSMNWRLDLLILESTGDISNNTVIYRRLGVLTLEYMDPKNAASPELLKLLKRSKKSLRNRLDPGSRPRSIKIRQCKEVFEELVANPWQRQTLIIV